MPKALQHTYPSWETDRDLGDEPRFVYQGAIRFVGKQRARKLRKRGVPLMPQHRVHDPNGEHRPGQFYPTHGDKARYAWFEVEADHEARQARRRLNCYLMGAGEYTHVTEGRKNWLRAEIEASRERHAAELFFRRGAKLAATLYYQTFAHFVRSTRSSLYSGKLHENLLQTNMQEVEARLHAAGYVPEGDGVLADSWVKPESTG